MLGSDSENLRKKVQLELEAAGDAPKCCMVHQHRVSNVGKLCPDLGSALAF